MRVNDLLEAKVKKDHVYAQYLLSFYSRGWDSKDAVVRCLLKALKECHSGGSMAWGNRAIIEDTIRLFREAGHDWPEFKAIEQSLEASK